MTSVVWRVLTLDQVGMSAETITAAMATATQSASSRCIDRESPPTVGSNTAIKLATPQFPVPGSLREKVDEHLGNKTKEILEV